MPTAAEVSPPSATDSRAATTTVSTPTTIIAKGRRATKAIRKYGSPTRRKRLGWIGAGEVCEVMAEEVSGAAAEGDAVRCRRSPPEEPAAGNARR